MFLHKNYMFVHLSEVLLFLQYLLLVKIKTMIVVSPLTAV